MTSVPQRLRARLGVVTKHVEKTPVKVYGIHVERARANGRWTAHFSAPVASQSTQWHGVTWADTNAALAEVRRRFPQAVFVGCLKSIASVGAP